MTLPNQTSIRHRLLLISMFVTLLTLSVAVCIFVINDVQTLKRQMVRDLEVLAEVVGENCLSALVFDAPETAEKNLASLRREYQIRYAILYDSEDRRFATYRRDSNQILREPVLPGDGVSYEFALFETGIVEVVQDLFLDGQSVGRIFIHAGMDELAAQMKRYAWLVGILYVLALAGSLLLALRLQRHVSQPILDLASKAHEVSENADYGVRVTPPAVDDEIAVLFRGFNAMLEQIDKRDQSLNKTRRDLEEANAKLRRLAIELALVSEQEKRRLAGELHDSPMQKLALAQTQISSAFRQCGGQTERLFRVGLELMREALKELRTLQFDLSPPVLHQEGLSQALKWLAISTSQRFGVPFSFTQHAALPDIEHDLEVMLFQCARELVHNVIKHAGASHGSIELSYLNGLILLNVIDNGKGFDGEIPELASGEEGGYGLYSIRERLSLVGGQLVLDSSPRGTRAAISMPANQVSDGA